MNNKKEGLNMIIERKEKMKCVTLRNMIWDKTEIIVSDKLRKEISNIFELRVVHVTLEIDTKKVKKSQETLDKLIQEKTALRIKVLAS